MIIVMNCNENFMLLENPNNKKQATVVGFDDRNHQVTSAMPGDMPTGGGWWAASKTEKGIEYVSNWYSKSYARKIFKKLTEEYDF